MRKAWTVRTKVRLPDGSVAEVVLTHVLPTVVEEAIRANFFDPPRAEKALRLARNMHAYNAKISCLLSVLSSGMTYELGSAQVVLHAIEEI